MKDIERDLDFIILKTQQLFDIVEREEYQFLETKELIRKQLIEQFFLNYSMEAIAEYSVKFEHLITLSEEIVKQCEGIFEQTKHKILKVKQVEKIKKAYK